IWWGSVKYSLLSLRAVYKTGNYVKVIHGDHYDEMGFIVRVTDDFLTVHDHRASTETERKEFVVPAHSVRLHLEPRAISKARAPIAPPLPLVKPRAQDDPYVGRNVRIIKNH
ncbi:hypothetical protein H0H92_014873, partial [Tricholoma furcatifolium]